MSQLFDQALATVSDDVKRFVDNSIYVADQIYSILKEKGISQRKFAEMLDKKESEISKWLSGSHNFTLKSISKMEVILNASIITTPLQAKHKFQEVKFVNVKTYVKKPEITASINNPDKYMNESSLREGKVKGGKHQIFTNGLKSA